MDDPVISASQSSIIYLFVRKFTIVGVIFYHAIFALHGFDFRTCLQVHTAVLCAQYREKVPKIIGMRLNLTVNLTLNQTPN